MKELDGPGAAPKSGGKAKQLVVFLHGYGSNGDDLISLAPYWADMLPDAEFLSPNAPFPCEMNPFGGYQWFGFQDIAPDTMMTALKTASTMLDAFLDKQLATRGFDESKLGLVGFSQGTMMALHVGPRRAKAPAAIVGYSGSLIGPEMLLKEGRSKPPVLLVHGMADPVVPFVSMTAANVGLEAAGIAIETLARPGLVHSIDQEGLLRGGRFLQEKLSG
jgi:phospholipase/carboxylesterase